MTSWLERTGRDSAPMDPASPVPAAEPPDARERRFTELYRLHYPFVLRFALRRLRALDAAQDATVATFAVVWSRFDEVPELPRAWIYRIARSVVSLELRQRIRDERLPGAARASRVRLSEQDIEGDPVLRAISELQDDDREVLQLRAWEDLTGEEIGEVLGCSPRDAAVRLHDAQQRLKELLSGTSSGDADHARHDGAARRPVTLPDAHRRDRGTTSRLPR